MNFWTGIIIGVFVGANIGIVVAGVLAASKTATMKRFFNLVTILWMKQLLTMLSQQAVYGPHWIVSIPTLCNLMLRGSKALKVA